MLIDWIILSFHTMPDL